MPIVEQQPLEKLQLQVTSAENKTYLRSALHKLWAQKREWMNFIPFTRVPESNTETSGGKDQWLAAAEELSQDLIWLLSLPHHCFWSQLVFDPGARGALLSYLEHAPRCYDQELIKRDEERQTILAQLHSLAFRVYMRICTLQESDKCYMTRSGHGNILYDNYLLDVPTMLDLCLLYGQGPTKKALAKSLAHVFDVQPKFTGDLESAAHMLIKALKDLEVYFVSQPSESSRASAIPLRNQAPGSKGKMNGSQVKDLILFLLDIVTSVSTLLELLPAFSKAIMNTTLEVEIARFYELVVPELYNNVVALLDDSLSRDLKTKVDTARYHLLAIAQGTLGTRVASIIETDDEDSAAILAEHYIAVMCECLAEPHFISDYHILNPIDQDLETLKQKCPEQLDSDKYAFLLESVFSCFDVPSRSKQRELVKNRVQETSAKSSHKNEVQPSTSNGYVADDDDAEALVLQSLVSEIQSILPDLGAGFVQRCLQHYNFNKEDVINAILEETLPNDLKKLDRTIPLPCKSATTPGPSIPVRLNVFDHDEFDVMSKDHIDSSRVHKGKRKSKHKNLSQLLNDKEDLKQLRDVYTKYSSVLDEYDDEYDDTYDEVNEVPVDEPDPYTVRRPFVTPRVLQKDGNKSDSDDCEEEAVGGAAASFVPKEREAFVQDPAEMRAKAEQRRASKMGQQNRDPRPPKDVVGKPKGQGQDNSVLVNRQKKNTNKSSQANHNRRAGAQRKMRQGMIPS